MLPTDYKQAPCAIKGKFAWDMFFPRASDTVYYLRSTQSAEDAQEVPESAVKFATHAQMIEKHAAELKAPGVRANSDTTPDCH